MLNLTKRSRWREFLDYFLPDFNHMTWDEVSVEGADRVEKSRTVLQSSAQVHDWAPLSWEHYRDQLLALRKSIALGDILAYELTWAPPKSFSVAAMAGPEILAELLLFHRRAVDVALREVGPLLVTRRMGRLIPLKVEAWRFPHPGNRRSEPHLHDHVLLLTPCEMGAIHAYPLYCHQRALRSLYHFALVSQLMQSGYVINQGTRSVLWELGGIESSVLAEFSQSSAGIREAASAYGYFERPVAERVAALDLRKAFPKGDSIRSLAEARTHWAGIVDRDRCIPFRRRSGSGSSDPVIPDANEVFRPSAVMSPLMVEGRILEFHLDGGVSLPEMRAHIKEWTERQVREGSILQDSTGLLCNPRVFEVEQRILGILENGLGKGRKHIVKGGKGTTSLRNAARRPDQVRLACVVGDPLVPEEFRDKTPGLPVLEMKSWDPFLAQELLEKHANNEVLLAVEGRFLEGEFLYSAQSIQTPSEPSSSDHWRAAGRRIELRLMGEPPVVLETIQPAMDEQLPEKHVGRRPGAVRIESEEVVPWEALGGNPAPTGLSLVALRNCDGFRHGTRYEITNRTADGSWLLRGKRQPVSDERFRAALPYLVLTRRRELEIAPGDILEILVGLRTPSLKLRVGAQVKVRKIHADQAIELDDGQVIPPEFRMFGLPGTFKKSPRKKTGILVVRDFDPDQWSWERLLKLKARRIVLMVAAAKLEAVRRWITKAVTETLKKAKNKVIVRIVGRKDGGEPYLGTRRQWIADVRKASLDQSQPASPSLPEKPTSPSRKKKPSQTPEPDMDDPFIP